MLKIVILEDEQPHLDKLSGYLARYRMEHPNFAYTLETYTCALRFLDAYQRGADLIFLDIRLPDRMGMDVARQIRQQDDNVMLIFVTNLTQYAVDGYSVGAFDYIVKPIHYTPFSAKLERALRVLARRETGLMLDLRTKEVSRRVPADSVIYIEISAHNLSFHMGTETISLWGTLSNYEEMLREVHFARPSNSYLVNLKYVRGVTRDAILLDNGSLPLSRGRRKAFLAALAQYKGGTV